jgi:hypothetical protein
MSNEGLHHWSRDEDCSPTCSRFWQFHYLLAIHSKRAALKNVNHVLLQVNIHSSQSENLTSAQLAPCGKWYNDSEMIWHRP